MAAPLTEFEKGQLDSVLRLGCNRVTASKYAGVAIERLQAEVERDPAFAQAVLQAESHPEVRHMGAINKAAQDEKNWRSSVWWLEHRAREQGKSADGSGWNPAAAVRDALDKLAGIVLAEIPDLLRRQALIAQFQQIADEAAHLAAEPAEPEPAPPVAAATPASEVETER